MDTTFVFYPDSSSLTSSNTNYVILGENPGSKHKKALDLGIEIITEENIKPFLKI